MASAFIEKRPDKTGATRYRVRYRLGGRETRTLFGGSFLTQREAKVRRDWIAGELAAVRKPDLRLVRPDIAGPPLTFGTLANRWRASRIDVSAGTTATYTVNLDRVLPTFQHRAPDEITPADVAALVAELHARGLKRESIRKTLSTLAQVLDFGEVAPNPVRHRTVKLPASTSEEVNPPTADHVAAVYRAIAPAYRLALLALDATGMRVSELEQLRWGDVDERAGRWRISRATAKTRQGRWVPVAEIVLQAVLDTVPREDRNLDGQVFAGFQADRFRTALGRACRATGTPAFSPHDLRHRRATLWHLSGVPVSEAAGWLGHSGQEHLKTYAHVVLDRTELDYAEMLERARTVIPR